ncbi:MAG TPA: carboxyl transferase domain-containing protein [Anaerolineales bacterium]|nr:carboxyl transferase domain-containing protein [Anaerolineales bacterium]
MRLPACLPACLPAHLIYGRSSPPELRAMRAKALQGGGAERLARQRARGKLTAHERLDLLLDPGTFNELEPFITHAPPRKHGNIPV